MITGEHRCALYPRDPNIKFRGVSAGKLQVFKGAAATFAFALLDKVSGSDAIVDVSDITQLTMIVRSASAVLVQKDLLAASLTNGITLDQWRAGTHQHAKFTLTASETNQAAADYYVTVWAYTNASPATPIVVGIGDITVTDVGLTAAAPSAPAAQNWQDVVNAALANTVKIGWNPPGVWFGLRSDGAGAHGQKYYVDSLGAPANEYVENPS